MSPRPTEQEARLLLAAARDATGQDYELAEARLWTLSQNTLALLKKLSSGSRDPLDTTLLAAVAERSTGEPNVCELALRLPDNLERTIQGSPSPVPQPEEIAMRLDRYYQDAPANTLAIHLVKQPHWPAWKQRGLLLYLGRQRVPTTLPALLRFAILCKKDPLRQLAAEGVEGFPREDAHAAKVAESRYWLHRRREEGEEPSP